jgi:hypothetical protein
MEIRMNWSLVCGPKYSLKTLPQILFQDPGYFFDRYEAGEWEQEGKQVCEEACKLNVRATNIRIPQKGPEKLVVEYTCDDWVWKVVHVEIVPESRPPHRRSFRKPVLDLSAGRGIGDYDKLGGELAVIEVKDLLLGGRERRMTQARCEAFFDDDRNFALGGVLVSDGHLGLEG